MRVLNLGRRDYAGIEAEMRSFTQARGPETGDELWLVEHAPVFTQGVAGRPEHVLRPGDIPIVQTNRGGQVTYHGPGQVVAYPLVDLKRLGIYVKEYVYRIEHGVLQVLQGLGVTGHRVRGAPGIYVRLSDPSGHAVLTPAPGTDPFAGLGKIAALGHQGQQPPQLSRGGVERGHGPGALHAHRPLRPCRSADGGLALDRRGPELGRGGCPAGGSVVAATAAPGRNLRLGRTFPVQPSLPAGSRPRAPGAVAWMPIDSFFYRLARPQ